MGRGGGGRHLLRKFGNMCGVSAYKMVVYCATFEATCTVRVNSYIFMYCKLPFLVVFCLPGGDGEGRGRGRLNPLILYSPREVYMVAPLCG